MTILVILVIGVILRGKSVNKGGQNDVMTLDQTVILTLFLAIFKRV